jgi:branched-chain amino acid transport system substrate-binding protein
VRAAAAGALLLAILEACAGSAGPPSFKLGLDLPLSGIDGGTGIPTRNAVILAVEEANRAGFPGGFHVSLEDLDDTVQGKHDPAQGAQNLKTLASDDAVLAVVGPLNSNVASAEIPVAAAADLALLTMGASAVGLTHPAPGSAPAGPTTFFRLCASDDRQGAAIAQFARADGRRRAFVIDDNESYGRGLADVFVAAFARDGGTVLGREHLTPFALDFKSLLTKARATHPDMLFFGGIVSTGGAVLRRQMGDVGLGTLPYYGGDGIANPEYVALAGPGADGTAFTLGAPTTTFSPAARAFSAAFLKRFGAEPGNYGPAAYAATQVALTAIRAELAAHPGRLPTRAEVRARIAATELVTPIGPVAFDKAGDLRHPTISLYRVRGGRVQFAGVTQTN